MITNMQIKYFIKRMGNGIYVYFDAGILNQSLAFVKQHDCNGIFV